MEVTVDRNNQTNRKVTKNTFTLVYKHKEGGKNVSHRLQENNKG